MPPHPLLYRAYFATPRSHKSLQKRSDSLLLFLFRALASSFFWPFSLLWSSFLSSPLLFSSLLFLFSSLLFFSLLFSSLLFPSLTLPTCAFHLSILSEVWLRNFLPNVHSPYVHVQARCQVREQFNFEELEQHPVALMLKNKLLKWLLLIICLNIRNSYFFLAMRLLSSDQVGVPHRYWKRLQIHTILRFQRHHRDQGKLTSTTFEKALNRLPVFATSKVQSTTTQAAARSKWREIFV